MTLQKMKSAVFAQKPVFKQIIERYGSLSLFSYFNKLGADYDAKNVPVGRRKELISLLTISTTKHLGTSAGKTMRRYLDKHYIVSTAAHHDFATHPFFANYLIAAGYANNGTANPVVPVLSCAGISLNNSSFPRGLLLHDKNLSEQRLKLVSLKDHHHPVYGYPSYNKHALNKLIQSIDRLALFPKEKTKLIKLVTAILDGDTLKQKGLDSQITRAVCTLSKNMPGFSKTTIAYLPQEKIAVGLFLKHHLNQKTVFGQIVFDQKIRAGFLKNLDGITGAHDSRHKTGTQLFWALSKTGRVALSVHSNHLVSADKSISIPLTPKAVKKALLTGKLMPAMSFTLTLLSFYYGLACAGGFSQVNYLTEMKSAYIKTLSTFPGLEVELAIAHGVPTDLFAGEFVLATLGKKKIPATALDIILNQHVFTSAHLNRLLKRTTLAQAVDRMIPELYKIITH